MTLRRLISHADLLEASGDDAFIRYDIPDSLAQPGYSYGTAVALPRQTHTRRLGLLVMGPPGDAARLLAALLVGGCLDLAGMRSVTVERRAFAAASELLPLGAGDDWEWMYAASPPPVVPAETGLVALSREHLDDIRDLLAVANPHTDARPFEFPDQHWVGARDARGRLVACGVREPNLAGWPILSGITVHPDARGTGLGLAVTAHLTRAAVEEHGICTLGMYSHNDVARRVYHGLGYAGDHLWSSRRLTLTLVGDAARGPVARRDLLS